MLDWTSLDNTSLSATDHFDNIYAETTECVNSHIPKKKVTKKALKLRSKPWINSNIQKLMHHRDKYFKSMTKNPSTTNKYLYCKFRNRVVFEQRKGKIKYFQSYFEKNKTNMKMLWTGIKSIVNVKAKNQISQISHLLDNGSQVNDPVKIRHYVSPDTLKLLYYSLFYSFISYGITVWGLTHPSYMDPLWKLQKKVI